MLVISAEKGLFSPLPGTQITRFSLERLGTSDPPDDPFLL